MVDEIKDIFISHFHKNDEALQHLKDLAAKQGLDLRDSSIHSGKENTAKEPDYKNSAILGRFSITRSHLAIFC